MYNIIILYTIFLIELGRYYWLRMANYRYIGICVYDMNNQVSGRGHSSLRNGSCIFPKFKFDEVAAALHTLFQTSLTLLSKVTLPRK